MADDSEVIKEFLIQLGVKVDDSSWGKFKKGVSEAGDLAAKAGKAAVASSMAVTAFVEKAAAAMDSLYFSSKRVGSSVSSIQDFGLSISQMGGSVDGARSSIENLGRFMRTNPGAAALLTGIGVKPEHLNDQVAAMNDLGAAFAKMPIPLGEAYAAMLGIDEATFLAIRSGKQMGDTYSDIYKLMGTDADKAAKSSNDLINKTKEFAGGLEALGMGWAAKFHAGMSSFLNDLIEGNKAMAFFTGHPGEIMPAVTDYLLAGRGPGMTAAENNLSAQKMMQHFISKGWSVNQAAGIVANLMRESSLNAKATGDGGKAFGLAQWHPDRQANFAKWAGHDIKQSTAEEQMDFVHYELTQGSEQRAGKVLRASKDNTGGAVSRYYERPKDTLSEAILRSNMANTLASDYNKNVNMTQNTTINVQGGGNAAHTAAAVADKQADVNSQLARNVSGAVE